MEEWRDIEGYEGLYQVSNWGRIKSLNYRYTGREEILKINTKNNGYQSVMLYKNKKSKRFSIHRLVAIHFINNPNNYPIINHKDENPSNNRAENLEWCTYKYNNNYGTKSEKLSKAAKGKYIGDKSPRAKKVKCITTGEIFNSMTEASKKYNISTGEICVCCKGGKRKSAGKHPVTGEKLVWKYIK